MTPDELQSRRDQVQIVDVRWPNEWEAGRIEGALHIPQDEIDDRLGEIDRDRPIVTVCLSGSRSAAAVEQLRAEGLEAENLDGGVQAWADAGLPLVADDGRPGKVVEPEPPADDRPPEHQRLQEEFLSVLMAVENQFGDSDPSDDEVRRFLRQRLIDEGRSPDEADQFLASMDEAH